jgi:hypothetical protein
VTILAVQEFPEGVAPSDIAWTYNADAASEMPNDGRTQLYVRNDEGTPLTCTATAKRKCSHGFLHNRPDTIGEDRTVPLLVYDRYRFNNTSGRVEFTLSRTSAFIAIAAVRVLPGP